MNANIELDIVLFLSLYLKVLFQLSGFVKNHKYLDTACMMHV